MECPCEGKPPVYCAVCHLRKKPQGRSAPLEMANSLCDSDCHGYAAEPKSGCLWPNEKCAEYGYCCPDDPERDFDWNDAPDEGTEE